MTFTCRECQTNSANWFCICTYPIMYLCESEACRQTHETKQPSHMYFSTDHMSRATTRDGWIHIKRDVEDIAYRKSVMVDHMHEIDAIVLEIEVKSDELKMRLDQRKNTLIRTLQNAKQTIVEGIAAAEQRVYSSMLDPNYQPHGLESSLMPRSTEAVQPFKGKVIENLDLVDQLLTLTYSSDFLLGLSHLLADIQPTRLQIFDIRTGLWRSPVELSEPIQIDKCSVSVFLPQCDLLCTGGGRLQRTTWASVYHIEPDGIVQRLKDMNWTRDSHGLILVQGCVYAFGGYIYSSRCVLGTAERLSIEPLNDRQRWSSLPDMLTPRYAFNPCAVERIIFLCGGGSMNRSEKFNIDTFEYSSLNFILPEHRECLVLQDKERLLILTEKCMSISDTNESNTLERRNHDTWGNVWGIMGPVKWGQNVYYHSTKGLYRIDLVSLARVQVPKP